MNIKLIINAIFKTFLLSVMIVLQIHFAYAQTTTAAILPPAKTTFVDLNGKPLTSGTVDFYIPGGTVRKTTWQDAAETIPNTNPVVLDSAGRAIILGNGSYRQVVKDRLGNIQWDQVTASAGSGSGGSTATGDGDLVGTIKPWAGMTAPNQYVFAYGQELNRALFPALFTAITSSQAVFCNSGSPTLQGLGDTTNFWIGMTVEIACLGAGNSTIISKTPTTVTMAANANVTTNTTAVFFPWGRGNGTTTFNMPDLRGYVLAGNDNMGGTAAGNLTTANFGSQTPDSSGAAGGSQTVATSLTITNLPPVTSTGNNSISVTSTDNVLKKNGSGTVQFASGTPTGIGYISPSDGTLISINGSQAISVTSVGTTNTPIIINKIQPTRMTNFIIKTTPDQNSATASGVTSLGLMTGDIACGTGLLCTGNIISSNNSTTTPRATIKIQRILPLPTTYGTETWGAYDQNNTLMCSGTNNTTALDNCIASAIAAAFPYAHLTPNSGYDFELIGGDEPGVGSPGGFNFGGGGAVLSSNTGLLSFPPIQNGNIRIGATSIVTGGNTDALVFNSCEMCNIEFLGSQTVAGGNGFGLHIKPISGTPVDNGVAFSPSRAFFNTIGGPTRFDLSGSASANIDYAHIEIVENNLGSSTVACGFLLDSPANGQNMGANTIKVGQLHGLGTAVTTMFCNGTQAPGGSAVLGQSYFDIGIGLDTAGGTNGFDEWGSKDEIHIHTTGLSTGYTLKFESGACNNVAYIWSNQASPTITDSSGCTGTSSNIWFVNGTMFIAGTAVPTSGVGSTNALAYYPTSAKNIAADANLTINPSGGLLGFGSNGGPAGNFVLFGPTSGSITAQVQGATGTWNWNWPVSAGSSGQPLITSGAGNSAFTWGTLGIFGGGTNCSAASITCFNNITGLSATGTTGTGKLVFDTSPTIATSLTVSGATNITGVTTIQNNGNAINRSLLVENNSSGSSAFSLIDIGNDTLSNVLEFGALSSTNSSFGGNNSAFFAASGNMWFGTFSNNPLSFVSNATVKMTLSPAGGLSIGTLTDPGAGSILANASIKSQNATSGIGYTTGAGGTVTQTTNRNTGVTLNTITGAITLVSALNAAVSGATANSMTVTNSAVTATDIPHVVQKSGTDLYEIFVTAVVNGAFKITYFTTGGTSTEQPVFNFDIIKGSTN